MPNIKAITLVSVLATGALMADQLTVSINGLGDPTTFSITDGSDLSLRTVEQLPGGSPNASTHILIDGLSPLEDGSNIFASTYRGINSTNGEEEDLGVLYLEMPDGSNLPEGTVSSPIVGVVQRPGPWSDYSIFSPPTSIGGAAGTSDISSGGDIIEAQLTRGGETFTGNIPYTVIDVDTIELDAFTMVKDGATSIDLSGATLLRDGLRFYGTLTNLSDGAEYDALLFAIDLTDIPDADNDGIPDISDPEISGGGGLAIGEWQQIEIGWVFGDTAEWGVSAFMGSVWMPFYPYIYQVNIGWTYHLPGNGTEHYFYDWQLGWLLTNEGWGGYYYIYGTAAYAEFKNPQP